jgi:glucosamine--fructose-6-phosphate aminotransferase (isomerizing)
VWAKDGQEHFLASDAMALAGVTDQIVYLEEGDLVDVQLGKYWLVDKAQQARCSGAAPGQDGAGAQRSRRAGPVPPLHAKGNFRAAPCHCRHAGGRGGIAPELFDQQMNHAPGANAARVFAEIDSVLILACGTSYYSGCTAKYWLEEYCQVPTQVEVASEYRYRDSVPNPRTLVVTITQSGETADTLAALRHAQSLGMTHTLTICNVATSAMVRECSWPM